MISSLPVEIPEVLIKRLSTVGTKRFIRVSFHNKNPIDQGWQKPENHRHPNDPILKVHLRAGGNYGIVGGQGLIIIDADIPELDKVLEQEFPSTFKVRSPRSTLPHRYYLTDLKDALRLRDDAGINIGDIQGPGKQVLGPGSIHPNGKPYEIVDDRELAFIGKELIRKVLGQWLIPEEEIEAIENTARQETTRFPDLTVSKIIDKYGIQLEHKQGDEFYGIHPQHGSVGGKNFWINTNKNTWHCFRHSSGGGPLSLIAVLEGIILCEEAIKGGLRGDKFVKVLRTAVNKQLLDENQLESAQSNNNEIWGEFYDGGTFVPKKLARKIQKKYRFATPGTRSDIYRYREKEGIWTDDGEKLIREVAARLLGEKEHKTRIELAIDCIKNNTYIDREKLEQITPKIVVKNGVFNLETSQLEPFDPDLYALNALPITYDPDKKCPKILKFINEIASKDIETLQEWIGYNLLRAHPYHKCLILVGDGRNGKSKFLSLLGIFLGKNNVSRLPLYLITTNINARTKLYGKLANIAADISSDELKRTGDFKALTGEDVLFCRKLYQEGFEFLNYAKLSFSANQIPVSPDQSRAFFSRWLIIGFPNRFEGENCDPAILSKLTTSDELSGLLNWALEGLRRLTENDEFTNSPTAEETQELYEKMSDPVMAFISDCVELEPGNIETKDDVYNAYFQFCRDRGFPTIMSNIFTKKLKPRAPTLKSVRRSIDKKQTTCWEGIRLLCDECGKCQVTPQTSLPQIQKPSLTTFGDPPLCEECDRPITDGSKVTWRDGRRVCGRCAMFLKKAYKEELKNG